MITKTYEVAGMTCGHCVAAVTREISTLPGVREVSIDLRPGTTSLVDVASDQHLDPSAVAAAVDEAGYQLVVEAPPGNS